MNITLLLAKERLNLYDAAHVVKEKFGGCLYDQALNLIIEKVETGGLPAEKIPATEFFDAMRTTVATAEIQAWLKGIAPETPAEPSTAPTTEAKTTVKWTPEKLAELNNEHNALKSEGHRKPTEALANKYGVSTQRIRKLLNKGKKESASPFSSPRLRLRSPIAP